MWVIETTRGMLIQGDEDAIKAMWVLIKVNHDARTIYNEPFWLRYKDKNIDYIEGWFPPETALLN